MAKTVTILVGLPRSGKSTWIKNNKREEDVIVSADQIRYLVYGQRFWSKGEPLTWAIREIILRMLMEQEKDIIIDECNVSPNRRKPIIDLAKLYKYEVNCIVICTATETCLQRARDLNDEYTESLCSSIMRMRNDYVYPEWEEGFNKISSTI